LLNLNRAHPWASKHKGKTMNKRLMRTNLLVLVFLMLVTAGSAFSLPLESGAVYQISARHSGKCLDVGGWSAANGALIIQWDCHGGENQQWTLFDVDGAGTYRIMAKHSDKALDVFGGIFSGANGVIVEQWDYNGSTNQMWKINDLGNGFYSVIAKHSGKGLDVRGASTGNGAQVQQYDFRWGQNQQFKFTRLVPCR